MVDQPEFEVLFAPLTLLKAAPGRFEDELLPIWILFVFLVLPFLGLLLAVLRNWLDRELHLRTALRESAIATAGLILLLVLAYLIFAVPTMHG
jgi:hypothetical protein